MNKETYFKYTSVFLSGGSSIVMLSAHLAGRPSSNCTEPAHHRTGNDARIHGSQAHRPTLMYHVVPELERECALEAHVYLLLQSVPEGAALPRILGRPNAEAEVFLVKVDISDVEEAIQSGEVIEVELEGTQLQLETLEVGVLLQGKLEDCLLKGPNVEVVF